MALSNLPGMGVSYGSLAQLTKPTMRGNAPVGDGFGAGYEYSKDRRRHDGMLEQATMMAQRDAEMKATAADEYAAGGPGRLANIRTGNALAQGNEANLPDLLRGQAGEARSKANKFDKEKLEEELKKLDQYAAEYAQAAPEDKQEIVNRMKADGVKVGKKPIAAFEAEGKIEALMARVRKMAVNTPAHEQKRILEKDKADAALKKEQEKIASKERVAKWVADAKSNAAKGKYQKAEKPEYVMFRDVYNRAQTVEEKDAVMTWWMNEMRAVEAAKAGAKPSQMDVNPNTGAVDVRQPPAVPAAKPPPAVGQGAAPAAAKLTVTPTPAHVNGYKQMLAKDPSKKAMIDAEWTRKFGTPPPK